MWIAARNGVLINSSWVSAIGIQEINDYDDIHDSTYGAKGNKFEIIIRIADSSRGRMTLKEFKTREDAERELEKIMFKLNAK